MHRIDASTFRKFVSVLIAGIVTMLTAGAPIAQELVVTPALAPFGVPSPRPVVVFPDLGTGLPNPARTYVAPLDFPALATHGLTLVAANRALATQEFYGKIDLIDTSTGTRIESYDLPKPTPTTNHDGYGTLAVNTARTHVLAVTSLDTLWVIPSPFDHTATATMLALPSSASTPQTRAIAFDGTTGRAYIALVTGIAVVDPPYTSVAFTIPTSNGVTGTPIGPVTGAIALSPDNATLVATRGTSGTGFAPDLRIFHAPFTVASVPEVLTIAGASLDGMTFTPDGSKVLVVENAQKPTPALPRVYSISAPFSAASTVETLQFDAGGNHDGFEDVDISADGQLAALSGGSETGDPLIVLKAPFTAAGFSFTKIDLPQFHDPYSGTGGRGDGTARFWSAAIPALPPQVWVDLAATDEGPTGGVQVTEGNSGTIDALVKVNLSGPSAQTVTIDYTTADGTATAADSDYIPITGTLTFAPGEVTKNIVVKVVGDTIYEYAERFTVVISNPVNATLLGTLADFADTGTVVILNDDAVVPLAITTTALPNGVTGTPYSFQLMGTGAHPLAWSISSNVPTLPLPAGLSLDAGTGIISGIPATPIALTESITLTDPIGLFANTSLSLTITGAGIPVLTPSPNPLDFGSLTVGTTSPILSATVTNTGAADLVLGSPLASIPVNSDFAFASGAGACTDGQTLAPSAQCKLYFTFKPQATGTRSLILNLASNAAAASLTLTGVGIPAPLPIISIANAASVVEGNSGTTPMTFAVTLAPVSGSTVTVNYAATGGTATIGVDYTVAGTGTLTFAPGITTQNITVNVIGDTQVEPDETVVMTLLTPSGATLGTVTAAGTILNDDASAPVLALLTPAPNFGNQVLATTSAPRSMTIGNAGGSNVVLATPFAVLAAGDFAYTSGANACAAGQTLAPAASCNLYVTFTPSALGTRTTSVVLSSNAPDVTLIMTGVGVSALSSSQPIPTLSEWALALLSLLIVAVVAARQWAQRGRAR
jgi:hypothetical protein